eukprot:5518218-Amphidinium_carterae.1
MEAAHIHAHASSVVRRFGHLHEAVVLGHAPCNAISHHETNGASWFDFVCWPSCLQHAWARSWS